MVATVWDGEVVGIRQAIQLSSYVNVLVVSDSKAALMAIVNAVRQGQGMTRDLVELVDEVGRCALLGLRTRFGCVNAHVGISGNKRADMMAKVGC